MPRLFIPTRRFSMRSRRPTPCVLPSALSRVSSAAGLKRLAVDRDRVAALELDRDLFGRVGRAHRVVGPRIDIFRSFRPRVFEQLPLARGVKQIGVGRERALAAAVLRHRDLVLFGEIDQRRAAVQVPFAPRRDDLDIGRQRIITELEAQLVVALAGRAVGDRVGADFARDLDLPLGDQRPRDRRAEQIRALVERVGAHHRKDEVADELLAQIVDEDVLRLDPHQRRLVARGLDLLALAEVGGEGHHLAAVALLQPFEDDAGVEPARESEDDASDRFGHRGLFVGAETWTRAMPARRAPFKRDTALRA